MGNAAALVVGEPDEFAAYAMFYGASDLYPNQRMI
jgi:hypothetical protein